MRVHRQRRRPAGAASEPLAWGPFTPCIPTLERSPPLGEKWVHEAKWDGYRACATIVGQRAGVWSRDRKLWNDQLPDIIDALTSLKVRSVQLDAELLAIRDGHHDFHTIRSCMSSRRRTREGSPLVLMVFDILHLNGLSLRDVPYLDRKRILCELLSKACHPRLQYSEHFTESGAKVFAKLHAMGFEGIVSKKVDSPYRSGRSRDWIKVKGRLHAQREVVTVR